ncbi:MAG: AMP-binding protein [Rubrivivax sp.]
MNAVAPGAAQASPPAASLALLAPRALAAPLAWRHGRPLSAAQFLAAAERLAERLPVRGRPANLCRDRLLFALGLAAALLRGQTSLLPPNTLPTTLRQLPAGSEPAYLLVDDAADLGAGMPALRLAEADLSSDPAARLAAAPAPPLAPGLDALCLLTSGSTGAPQPHVKRWGALAANIGAAAARLAALIGRADLHGLTLLATVPAQHSYGLESSVLLALLGGAAFDAGRPFYPADIAAALARLPRPRALVTTPFHLKTLLDAGLRLPQADLVLSATAPLTPQLAARAEAALDAPLVEIYGCTEAGQIATRRTAQGETWHAFDALRLGCSGDGVQGERFFVAGGHVGAPTPLADLLELVDETHFRLLGRANDLVHVAGKRSSLAHLNFHLNRIAGVDDGAFWLPDEVPGEVTRPIAFVVAPRLAAHEIVAALRRELDAAFVPRRVIQVEALPREATGKLSAGALRRFALATLAALGGPQGRSARDDTRHARFMAAQARGAEDEAAITLQVPADHPAFAGHFPGRPVLPGATLLALVLAALEARPVLRSRLAAGLVVEQVKFLAAVEPGSTLVLRFAPAPRGLGFEVRAGERVVARGMLGGLGAPDRAPDRA